MRPVTNIFVRTVLIDAMECLARGRWDPKALTYRPDHPELTDEARALVSLITGDQFDVDHPLFRALDQAVNAIADLRYNLADVIEQQLDDRLSDINKPVPMTIFPVDQVKP